VIFFKGGMPQLDSGFVGRSLLEFLVKPIPFLLKPMILAPSLRRTVAPLIGGMALALALLPTLRRAITLPTPTRAAYHNTLGADTTAKLDPIDRYC
jgi:hypothetical protein